MKSMAREEIDKLAAAIQAARDAAQTMHPHITAVKARIDVIESAAILAQEFSFVPEELKAECRRVLDSMRDANRLLNSAEIGGRGIAVNRLMEALWRELP